nr:hypothetical protein BaRGS_019163 [Batillaria attramentaria]
MNGMRRSSSENKLIDRKNVRNARLNSSRNLSVGRTDKLTQRRSRHGAPASNASVTNRTGMRRVNSVSAINVASNRTSRLGSVFQDGADVDGQSGDSEEEEEKSVRIREWLDGLEFADAPPDPVIDYADDPPQTDTAVHIVYGEDD